MEKINLSRFKRKANTRKKGLRRFLTRLENHPPRGLDRLAEQSDKEAWKEVNCLSCANCCKTMSPTYTAKDIRRISAHLGMTEKAFREKWLYKDKTGDWLNVKQPCQFLDLSNNMCSIYEVRPADCAGFPHHTKKKMVEYMHMFRQNVEYCPATYQMVEIMKEKINGSLGKRIHGVPVNKR